LVVQAARLHHPALARVRGDSRSFELRAFCTHARTYNPLRWVTVVDGCSRLARYTCRSPSPCRWTLWTVHLRSSCPHLLTYRALQALLHYAVCGIPLRYLHHGGGHCTRFSRAPWYCDTSRLRALHPHTPPPPAQPHQKTLRYAAFATRRTLPHRSAAQCAQYCCVLLVPQRCIFTDY